MNKDTSKIDEIFAEYLRPNWSVVLRKEYDASDIVRYSINSSATDAWQSRVTFDFDFNERVIYYISDTPKWMKSMIDELHRSLDFRTPYQYLQEEFGPDINENASITFDARLKSAEIQNLIKGVGGSALPIMIHTHRKQVLFENYRQVMYIINNDAIVREHVVELFKKLDDQGYVSIGDAFEVYDWMLWETIEE